MISNKLLQIKECYFNLPDDFNGSLGEALMLLAQYRLKCEENQKIKNMDKCDTDTYASLMTNNESKCSIAYSICQLSEDGSKWEQIK